MTTAHASTARRERSNPPMKDTAVRPDDTGNPRSGLRASVIVREAISSRTRCRAA